MAVTSVSKLSDLRKCGVSPKPRKLESAKKDTCGWCNRPKSDILQMMLKADHPHESVLKCEAYILSTKPCHRCYDNMSLGVILVEGEWGYDDRGLSLDIPLLYGGYVVVSEEFARENLTEHNFDASNRHNICLVAPSKWLSIGLEPRKYYALNDPISQHLIN